MPVLPVPRWTRPLAAAAALGACAAPAAPAAELRWPAVAPLERTVRFGAGDEQTLVLPVTGGDGRPLYRLCCAAPLQPAPCGDADVFSGLFMCTLRPAAGGPDLLVEDPFARASWETRARYLAEDLDPERADPGCGPARRFRLRGMTLTLELTGATLRTRPVAADPLAPLRPVALTLLDAFTFAVRVAPNPTAWTERAEPVVHVVTPGLPRAAPGAEDLRGRGRCAAARVPGRLSDADLARLGLLAPYPRVTAASLRHRLDIGGHAAPPAAQVAAAGLVGGRARTPGPGPGAGPEIPPLSIRDAAGREAYRLTAHWSHDPGAAGVWFRLTPAGSDVDLLGEGLDPVTRRGRAYFALDDLEGACARYPGWGARREFRLRGMRVLLELERARLHAAGAPPRPDPDDWAATIVARVQPDAGATSPVAAPWPDLDPRLGGPGCAEPLRLPVAR